MQTYNFLAKQAWFYVRIKRNHFLIAMKLDVLTLHESCVKGVALENCSKIYFKSCKALNHGMHSVIMDLLPFIIKE